MKYKTITLPVTKVRDQLFDLVNAGYYAGQRVIITKNKKKVMELVPVKKNKPTDTAVKKNKQQLDKFLQSFTPFLTEEDVKDMQKTRESLNTPRFPDW